jgi:hypothetical protein
MHKPYEKTNTHICLKETKPFVEKLFSSLATRDYMPIKEQPRPESDLMDKSDSVNPISAIRSACEDDDEEEDEDRSHKHVRKDLDSPSHSNTASNSNNPTGLTKRSYSGEEEQDPRKKSRTQGDPEPTKHGMPIRPYSSSYERDSKPHDWRGRTQTRRSFDTRPRQRCRDYEGNPYLVCININSPSSQKRGTVCAVICVLMTMAIIQ